MKITFEEYDRDGGVFDNFVSWKESFGKDYSIKDFSTYLSLHYPELSNSEEVIDWFEDWL